MNPSPLTRSERLEYEETLRLLACLIFEIQGKGDEDLPGNIFGRLEALIDHAPPAVLPLVEHLRQHSPQERAGEIYTYSLPYMQWQCGQSLPTWEIVPRSVGDL